MSLYGIHRDDAAWTQTERPDEPTPAEMALENPPDQGDPILVVPLAFFTGDDQDLPNELFDTPEPAEDAHLEAEYEDRFAHFDDDPNPYEDSLISDDPDFTSDRYGDDWE